MKLKAQTIVGLTLSVFFGIYFLAAFMFVEFRAGNEQEALGAVWGFFTGLAFLGGIWAIFDARRPQ